MSKARNILATIFETGFEHAEEGRPYDYADELIRRMEEQGFRFAHILILDQGPCPFVLQRDEDVTGISGTGIVAEGVEFSDGSVALKWRGDWPTSVVFHKRGIQSVKHVHGHDGKTKIVGLVEDSADDFQLRPADKEDT